MVALGWTDLADALTPNGRLSIRARRTSVAPRRGRRRATSNGLYLLATLTGYVAPTGRTPTADLPGWKARSTAASRQGGRRARDRARAVHNFHSSVGARRRDHAAAPPGGLDRRPLPRRAGPARVRGFRRSSATAPRGAPARRPRPQPRGPTSATPTVPSTTRAPASSTSCLRHTARPRPRQRDRLPQTCPQARSATGPIRARSWSGCTRASSASAPAERAGSAQAPAARSWPRRSTRTPAVMPARRFGVSARAAPRSTNGGCGGASRCSGCPRSGPLCARRAAAA